jgi:SnoaL-like domain
MNSDERFAILALVVKYSYAWDAKDADGFAALFAEDAVVDYFLAGETERFLRRVAGGLLPDGNRHVGDGNAESGPVNGPGKPGEGKPHARIDEGELETGHGLGTAAPAMKCVDSAGPIGHRASSLLYPTANAGVDTPQTRWENGPILRGRPPSSGRVPGTFDMSPRLDQNRLSRPRESQWRTICRRRLSGRSGHAVMLERTLLA